MQLLADRDPEEARKILDPVLKRMMEAVHRYEGTVNQVMGDGIMALFGAPLIHEDHAVRACYAALRMQAAIGRYADELRCGIGASSGRRPSVADYVRGPAATLEATAARRSVLMLPTLSGSALRGRRVASPTIRRQRVMRRRLAFSCMALSYPNPSGTGSGESTSGAGCVSGGGMPLYVTGTHAG